MRRSLFILTLFFFICVSSFAQSGKVHIYKDSRLDVVVDAQRLVSEKDNTFKGYRVQIFMQSGKQAYEEAKKVETDFIASYPDIPVYIDFAQPYYRVRVGDFRTNIEAESLQQKIKEFFPEAFVTTDNINQPKLTKIIDEQELNLLLQEYEQDTIQEQDNVQLEEVLETPKEDQELRNDNNIYYDNE